MKYFKMRPVYIIFFLVTVAACTKIDDFKDKFMANGPIDYTGKMDSVQIFSGKNRVKIQGLLISDPNIAGYEIFWNGGTDSLNIPFNRSSEVDTVSVIISDLTAGQKTFEIKTYDLSGNHSIPVFKSVNVYGDLYEEGLINRGIVKASMQDDGSALIIWQDVSENDGPLFMEIKYMDNNMVEHDTIIQSVATNLTTVLTNFKLGRSFSYQTAYLPTPFAIDTFYANYESHSVQADVTDLYLTNTGPGFLRGDNSGGRFGVLGAPWIENAAAKNKAGGTIGGYASDWRWGYNGQINWETWGNTPVTDGKIYQVTSKPLPEGSYTVKFQYYSEIQSNSSVYCIAAAGADGIPSLPGLSSALGYTLLYNGANVGATSPNLEEIKSFSFTLDSPQIVSIGFLGNLVGNGNPGNYFVVGYIRLIKN